VTDARISKRPDLGALASDRRAQLAVLLVVLFVAMSLLSPYFLLPANLLSMTQYGAVTGLLAVGQALVILGGRGGIDLSIGAMLSLSGIVMGALTAVVGLSPWLAAVIALAFGMLLGAVNGVLIAIVGLPPIIVTLSTQFLFASLALVATSGASFVGLDRDGFAALGQTAVAGVPTQVLAVLLPVFLVAIWFQSRTRTGLVLSQVGISERAAFLVGIDTRRVRLGLYIASGFLAALGAVVTNSWLLTARPGAGSGLELQAITIAVLGGIDIFGGRGRLSGVFLALMIVVVLSSGLQLANVGNTLQAGILGAVLVLSVLLNNVFGKAPRA
jgi:ribose/xylose/arabinose/galactoside ABC-type transport system permease subunit